MLDPAVLALLNRQINAEQYAAHLYTAIASWADQQAFPGLEAWAAAAALEEDAHARHFLDYANARDMAELGPIIAPPAIEGGYAGALQAALDAEQSVSAALGELHMAAMAAGDAATCLLASRQLLDEQVPAEKEIATYLARIARGAPIDLLDAEIYEGAN